MGFIIHSLYKIFTEQSYFLKEKNPCPITSQGFLMRKVEEIRPDKY